MVKEAVMHSTRYALGIRYPSQVFGSTGKEIKIDTVESVSFTRNREQRMIPTIGRARSGFVTIEGDLVASITLSHLDEAIPKLESLYASNQPFDIVVNEREGEDQGEWEISEILAVGCLFETVTDTIAAGDKPMREYSIKYLENNISDRDGRTYTERDGHYWKVNVQW